MYRGIIFDFPCGQGGLNGNQNVAQIPINELIKARNIRYDGFTFRKAPGLGLFDSNAISGAPTALAGYDWRPSSGVQRQVTAWSDGAVYKETGSNVDAVTLVSGLSPSGPVTFVPGGNVTFGSSRKLYMFAKGVAPKVLDADGVTMTGITNESTDWASTKPGGAIPHDSRIFAFDVDGAPHNFYISSLADFGDFTASDARTYQINPGIGERIVAGCSFLPTQAYLIKYPVGIWVVDTTDLSGSSLPIQLVRADVGMAGPHGIAKVGTDWIIISSNGRLYSLMALRPDVDPTSADITAKLNLTEWIKRHVNANRLAYARLVYDELRKELWYIYTSKDGTTNDSALILDMNDPNNPKIAYEDRGTYFNAVWPKIGTDGFTELMCAGTDGLVYRANRPNCAIGASTSYIGELQWADTDLGHVDRRYAGVEKRFDFLEVTVIPTGQYDLNYEIIIDGTSRKTGSISLSAVGNAIFDSAVFDTDAFGGQTLATHRIELDVVGNTIGIRFWNTGLNEEFVLVKVRGYGKVSSQQYEA